MIFGILGYLVIWLLIDLEKNKLVTLLLGKLKRSYSITLRKLLGHSKKGYLILVTWLLEERLLGRLKKGWLVTSHLATWHMEEKLVVT